MAGGSFMEPHGLRGLGALSVLRSSTYGALMRYVLAVLRTVLAGLALTSPAAIWLLLFGGS
jgi:LDH2 family malate/lactate/ureidoglycolate dehydrogenase